jgi:hypothetical protein
MQSEGGLDLSSDVVTAHEIGTFVYCPEQWRLENGLGLRPVNRTALASGNRHHARKARAERSAGHIFRVGQCLILAGLFALLVFWMLRR